MDSTPAMRKRSAASPGLDLRSFRQQVTPGATLGKVAGAAKVHKSLLSRIETGRRAISLACARKLARYYSQITGRRLTVGRIVELAERAKARRLHGAHGAPPGPERR